MPDQPVIEVRNVSKAFGANVVLRDIDAQFETGRTTVIIGPSGTGKSVLLKILVGLMKPDAGEVHFDGQRIDHWSDAKLDPVRTQFGFLFQLGALFDSLTVGQNIEFPMVEHGGMTPEQRHDRCSEVLGLVDMDGFEQQMPADLSGGQRKRVALARAIALHPRVIFYDEPTTGLDPVRSDEISDLIVRLSEGLHVTSIVVTHDMASAYKIADRILMLYDGDWVADGKPDELRNTADPLVRDFVEGRGGAFDRDEPTNQP